MRLVLLGATAVILTTHAHAQTVPASSLPTPALGKYLDSQFIDVVQQCAGISRFKRKGQTVSPIPSALQSNLRSDLALGYQELAGRSLTDLYSSIWKTASVGADDLDGHKKVSGGLGLRFSNADDRVVYGEANSTRHTHNCSTVVSFAVSAGAKLGGEELAAALRAGHDDTRNLSLSLVAGTFRSPIWAAFSIEPGVEAAPRENRFGAYTALWQWYAATPAHAADDKEYFLLDELQGLAIYRFSGLTWKTEVSGKGAAGGSFAVVSASSSIRGQLEASGSTDATSFSIVRFARAKPVFKPLPSVVTAAKEVAASALFIPVGDWSVTPVTNTAPIKLVHDIALPAALCTNAWTSNSAVTSLTVRPHAATADAPEMCRFTATFTPTATATSGAVPIQYEATLAFPTVGVVVTGRDLKLIVGKGETLADYRARISLLSYQRALSPTAGGLSGAVRFRINTAPGTTVQSFVPNPNIYVSCEGEDKQPAVAVVDLVTPSVGQASVADLRISDVRTTRLTQLTRTGGTCEVSGQIQAVVAGVTSPILIDLGTQLITVTATAPSSGPLGALVSGLEKASLRINAASQ